MPDENNGVTKKIHENIVFWIVVLGFLGGVMLCYASLIERQARTDEQVVAMKERLVRIEVKLDILVAKP